MITTRSGRTGTVRPSKTQAAPGRGLLSAAAAVLVGLLGGCSPGADSSGTSATGPDGARIERPERLERSAFARPADQPLPNVIFILVDTLRADRLGSYGHAGKLTPVMDGIAAEGVRFSRAISPAPWTLPSIASIMTGYQATVHKASSFRKIDHMDRGIAATVAMLDDSFVTLPEIMQQAGYETAGFVANKFIKPQYGMAQGFDHYDTEFADNTVRGELLNGRALKWLASRERDKPFFLYLHYMDVHGPYDAAPEFLDRTMAPVEARPVADLTPLDDGTFNRINTYLRRPPRKSSDPTRWERLKRYREYWDARYDAGVAEMDFYLGQLVEGLKQQGAWDDAYVVLTADHGEALGERGLWDHGYSQFQTDLAVPLAIRWPGVVPGGRVAPDTASLLGLAPTIYEQLGLDFDQNVQGESLVGHMAGSADVNDYAIAEAIKVGPTQLAVVRGPWKLIAMQHQQTQQVGYALFNLDEDPGETKNLSGSNPEQRDALKEELVRFVQKSNQLKPGIKSRRAPIDPAEFEKLKAVGYVGGDEEEEDD